MIVAVRVIRSVALVLYRLAVLALVTVCMALILSFVVGLLQ